MAIFVSATALCRDVGLHLRRARREVVAVMYHGEVAGYLISPDVYVRVISREPVPVVDGHAAAVARMEVDWAAGRR